MGTHVEEISQLLGPGGVAAGDTTNFIEQLAKVHVDEIALLRARKRMLVRREERKSRVVGRDGWAAAAAAASRGVGPSRGVRPMLELDDLGCFEKHPIEGRGGRWRRVAIFRLWGRGGAASWVHLRFVVPEAEDEGEARVLLQLSRM